MRRKRIAATGWLAYNSDVFKPIRSYAVNPRCVRAGLLSQLLLIASWACHSLAGTTSLALQGEPGTYLLGDHKLSFTIAEGNFSAMRASGGVRVVFENADGEYWSLTFGPPSGQTFAVAEYGGAVRFPFQNAGQPGLNVDGRGAGCNTVAGRFTVKQLVFGPNSVVSFWATFEQHCENQPEALRGEVRWNADPPVLISTPRRVLAPVGQPVSFDVAGTATNGGVVNLTAAGLPDGASLSPQGSNLSRFTWVPSLAQAGVHEISIVASNALGFTDEAFVRLLAGAPIPSNDEISNATEITQLPFVDALNNSEATWNGDPVCSSLTRTVWYRFTPAEHMTVEMSASESDFTSGISVFTGSPGNLTALQCNYDAFRRFRALADTTYYFQVGVSGYPSGSNLVFRLIRPEIEIPPHDDFTNAIVITSLPFRHSVNISGTTAYNEPFCSHARSVWYAYTATQDMALVASVAGDEIEGRIGIYTGSLGNLTSIACGGDAIRFQAVSNETYYFQAGTAYSPDGTNLLFSLQEAHDIGAVGLIKANLYLQKRANSRGSYLASAFATGVDESPTGDIRFVDLRAPFGRVTTLPVTSSGSFSMNQRYRNRSSLTRAWPAGDYVFTIGAFNDGTNEVSLALPANDFPNIPHVNNWKAAQSISAEVPFTFVWDGFIDGTLDDQIRLEVLEADRATKVFATPNIGTRNAVHGRQTSFVLPGGTLAPGREYFGIITFARHALFVPEITPGAIGVSSFLSVSGFPLHTTAGASSGVDTIGFSSARYNISEHNRNAVVTVVRTGGSSGLVSVDFSTADGTATEGADYQGEAVTLVFADGETSKAISVPVYDDGLVEGTETIVLTLQNPTGGARLGTRRATIQLRDANQP